MKFLPVIALLTIGLTLSACTVTTTSTTTRQYDDHHYAHSPCRNTSAGHIRGARIVDHYHGHDGGYVAIYSRSHRNGYCLPGSNIYVNGFLRIKGHYSGKIFHPAGYCHGQDISRDPPHSQLSRTILPRAMWRLLDRW